MSEATVHSPGADASAEPLHFIIAGLTFTLAFLAALISIVMVIV